MHVLFGLILFAFGAVTDFEASGLVIGTVRAGNEFSVGVVTREPSLEIVLFTGRVIEFSRANRNYSVGQAEGLHEHFGV